MVKKLTLTFMNKKKRSVEKLLAFRIYWTRKQMVKNLLWQQIPRFAHNIKLQKNKNRIYPKNNNTT